jgi:hypothetical protein
MNQFYKIIEGEHVINGRKIICRPYFDGKIKNKFLQDLQKRRVFVKNIPTHYSDNVLTKIFSAHGEVLRAYAIREVINRKSKGFGYVSFKNESDAQKLIERGFISSLEGNKIQCL